MSKKRPNPRRSRAELDDLADGVDDRSPLAGFLAEMRSMKSTPPTPPNRGLTEFVSAPSRAGSAEIPAPRRRKVLTVLTTAAGTTVGKLVLTGTAAAALVTGVAFTDAIRPDGTEVIAVQDDSSDGATPSSSSDGVMARPQDAGTIDVAALQLPDGEPTVITAADGGTVTVQVLNGTLSVVSVDPARGWSAVDDGDDADINEIEISFRRGDERVDVELEIDDGQVRVRVRDRRSNQETETTLDGQPFVDDDDDDEDNDLDDDNGLDDDDLDDEDDLDDDEDNDLDDDDEDDDI